MKEISKSFVIILFILLTVYFYKNNFLSINNNNYTSDISNTRSNIIDKTKNDNISNNFTRAFVSKIVDGDTIEVIIDSKKYKVRFIGVDCPEYTSKTEYYGKESTEYTTSMLNNKYVFLEKDISETDKYGRLLRYVWLEVPTSISTNEIKLKMFNGLLIDNGYASEVSYPPDVKYSIEFKKIATTAKNNHKGLWNE